MDELRQIHGKAETTPPKEVNGDVSGVKRERLWKLIVEGTFYLVQRKECLSDVAETEEKLKSQAAPAAGQNPVPQGVQTATG